MAGSRLDRAAASFLGLLLVFAACARGAHDLWAATLVYLASLFLFSAVSALRSWSGPGIPLGLLAPALAAAAAVSLSFAGSVNPSEAFLGWGDVLASLGVFLTALLIFRDRETAGRFLSSLVPFFWAQFFLVLWQQTGGHPQGGGFFANSPPGTFTNANLAAAFNILWIPALAWRWRESRGKPGPERWFWLSGLLSCVGAFLLFYSTWSYVCVALCLPLAAGPSRLRDLWRRHRNWVLAAAAASMVCAGALVWWKLSRTAYLNGTAVPEGAKTARLSYWLAAWRMFLANPWFGVGVGNFPSAYLAFRSGPVQNTLFAHSLPLKVLAETGLTGAAASLGLLLWWARRLRALGLEELEAFWPFVFGVMLFLLFGLMSIGAEYLANLLGLAAAMGIAAAPAAGAPTPVRRSVIAGWCALALAVVPYAVSPFLASRMTVRGFRLLRQGDLQAARTAFLDASETDRLACDARRGLARTFFQAYREGGGRTELEAALTSQREALRLDRLNGAAHRELAAMLLAAGRPGDAAEVEAEAVRLGAPPLPPSGASEEPLSR